MRFAGNSSNTNSFIAAGKAAARSVTDLFKVARENSPDYGMLANENMKNRSKERQVANAAEAAVRREGIKALTQVKKTGIQVDAKEKILGMKLDANRKAGIVGALGAVAGGGLMAIENNRAKKVQAERDAAADARDAQSLAIQEGLINSYSQYTPAEFDKNNPEHNPGWKGNSFANSLTTGSSSNPNPSPSNNASLPSVSTGGTVTAKTIAEMAAKSGAKYPKLVAAQWALESAWGTKPSGKNNYFGIKATGGESSTAKGTWEVIDGKEVTTTANFKNYDSPQGSVNDLVSKWYQDYGNYRGVNRAGSASEAADLLVQENYATDPNYASKLKDIMSRFDF